MELCSISRHGRVDEISFVVYCHPPSGNTGGGLEEEEKPQDGESYILRRGHHGKALSIAIPQPKTDGEPLAAITDYLNTTFPFSPTSKHEDMAQGFKSSRH